MTRCNACKHPALPPVPADSVWLTKEMPTSVCPWCGATTTKEASTR